MQSALNMYNLCLHCFQGPVDVGVTKAVQHVSRSASGMGKVWIAIRWSLQELA